MGAEMNTLDYGIIISFTVLILSGMYLIFKGEL